MRRVVSISLGASDRNHSVETEILGERFLIERIGTDGSKARAIAMIRELDGKVDAFGMGGTDLYVWAGRKRLILRDSLPLARAAQKTPIVDGSGLKNTLERRVVEHLVQTGRLQLRGMKALMVSGVDRFGMAEALIAAGAQVTFGDLPFLVGLPLPIYSLRTLELVGRTIGPVIASMPIQWLYPTGEKQRQNTPKHGKLFAEHHLIAGDFHLIRRYMPERMDGKIVLTNTVTRKDVEELKRRGVAMMITTTPELNGRSFGTNVMEGVLVALSGKHPTELAPADYNRLLDQMGFQPRIERFTEVQAASAAV